MGYSGEYRIQFYRDDESLSFVMVLHARADMDAKGEAEKMLKQLIKANEAGGSIPNEGTAALLSIVLKQVTAFRPATRQ